MNGRERGRCGFNFLATRHLTMRWGEGVITHWGSATREKVLTRRVRSPEDFSRRRHLLVQDFGRRATYLPSSVFGQPRGRQATAPLARKAAQRPRLRDCARPRTPSSLPLPADRCGAWRCWQDGGVRENDVSGEAKVSWVGGGELTRKGDGADRGWVEGFAGRKGAGPSR